MKITKTSPITGVDHTLDIPITEEQYKRWMDGELVQEVFNNLSEYDREFLITGITAEEWNKYIVEPGYVGDDCDQCDDELLLSQEEYDRVQEIKEHYQSTMSSISFTAYYEVRLKDIDPDTGSISQDTRIAICETRQSAEMIANSINTHPNNDDPNREIYIKYINLLENDTTTATAD